MMDGPEPPSALGQDTTIAIIPGSPFNPSPVAPRSTTITAAEPVRRFYIPTASAYVSPTFPTSRSRSSLGLEDSLNGSSNYLRIASTASPRYPLSGQRRDRGRGKSLVALTTALQNYRVPPPVSDDGSDAGEGSEASLSARSGLGVSSRTDHVSTSTSIIDVLVSEAGPSVLPCTPPPRRIQQPSTLDPPFTPAAPGTRGTSPGGERLSWSMTQRGEAVDMEIMDALVDIHRVLYGGREDQRGGFMSPGAGGVGAGKSWEGEVQDLERVISRWFESDAVYDHPVFRLASRSSLLSHFVLLHLLQSGSVPAMTPENAIGVARKTIRSLTERAYHSLLTHSGARSLTQDMADEEARAGSFGKESVRGKGKGKWNGGDFDMLGDKMLPVYDPGRNHENLSESYGERWKLWQVRAECTELGGMECYDGYHLGLIEHVITFNIFPSLTHPRSHIHPRALDNNPLSASSSSTSISSLDALEVDQSAGQALIPTASGTGCPRSFVARLASAAGREFGYLLTWELPMSTTVQFNEVGKVTHIRDSIDVQDLIETFVPFAKRLSWLTRRISGLVSSSIGGLVMSVLLPSGIKDQIGTRGEMVPILAERKRREVFASNLSSDILNLDVPSFAADRGISMEEVTTQQDQGQQLGLGLGTLQQDNSLGLEGMLHPGRTQGAAGMAPDMDC